MRQAPEVYKGWLVHLVSKEKKVKDNEMLQGCRLNWTKGPKLWLQGDFGPQLLMLILFLNL